MQICDEAVKMRDEDGKNAYILHEGKTKRSIMSEYVQNTIL